MNPFTAPTSSRRKGYDNFLATLIFICYRFLTDFEHFFCLQRRKTYVMIVVVVIIAISSALIGCAKMIYFATIKTKWIICNDFRYRTPHAHSLWLRRFFSSCLCKMVLKTEQKSIEFNYFQILYLSALLQTLLVFLRIDATKLCSFIFQCPLEHKHHCVWN